MEKRDAACFLVDRISHEAREAAVDHVRGLLGVDPGQLCRIQCGGHDTCPRDDRCCISLHEFYVRMGSVLDLFRKYATFLGRDDHLIALQLCIAEVNKQKDGKFDVLSSDVLYHHNRIMSDRLASQSPHPNENDSSVKDRYLEFLSNTNTIDATEAYLSVRKYLLDPAQQEAFLGRLSFAIFELPKEALEKSMLELLASNKRVYNVAVETPLDNSLTSDDASMVRECKIHFQIEETNLEDAVNKAVLPRNSIKPESVIQLHMERAIMAYFRIIVNSRDEIALATALSSMTQVFSHQAFTALKNKAKVANLSMYQMAVSLITRMKLGGKGYALDPSSPLMPFLPEIFAFTELLGKIQTIVEEDLDTKNAIGRIIKLAKGHVSRTCNPKIHKKSIEAAAARLEAVAEAVVDRCLLPFLSNVQEAENCSSVVGQHTIDSMRLMVNIHNATSSFGHKTQVLTDGFASQGTPVRLPSLISQFRSPENDKADPEDPKPLIHRVKSRMLKARQTSGNTQNVSVEKFEEPTDNSCCTVVTTPLKVTENRTTVDSTPEKIELMVDHENTRTAKNGPQWPHRTVKRALLTTDEDRSTKTKKAKAARKPQKPKGKQQISGQQLMTRFLKV